MDKEYPAKVEIFKVDELGIEKILIQGQQPDIDETVRLLTDEGGEYHVLDDAWLMGFDDIPWNDDDVVWGEQTRIEIYRLWLLRKSV